MADRVFRRDPPAAICNVETEQGFMLLGLIVAIFFILLALSIAAPRVSEELKREREVEAVHRGNQFVRAIQLYYRKTHAYPPSIEALEKTNNIRYLRQRYVDPMTGKPDWKLIHVGEAKTTVKGFFGQPLAGLAPGLGAAAGMASSGTIGAGAAGSSTGSASPGTNSAGSSSFGSSGSSSFGSSSGSSFGSPSGSSSFGSSSGSSSFGSSSFGSSSSGNGASSASAGGVGGSSTGSGSGLGAASGMQSQSATGFTGSGAPFVGVGVPKEGNSLVVLNEQTTYQTWEFIYDPRIEQLKASSNILGGGGGATGQGLGSAAGMSSGIGGSNNTNSSGFGSGSSGFGSGSGSGFGSSTNGSGSSGSSFGSSSFGSSGSTQQNQGTH